MRKAFKPRFIAVAIAAVTTVALLLGGPVAATANPGEELQVASVQEQTDEGSLKTNDSPLDFAADPSSREGAGWKWDQSTATLTIDQMFLDLTDYGQDYTAAIVFPDGPAVLGAPATICITGDNMMYVNGLNSDGGRRMSIYSAGDLIITGAGSLIIDASNGAAGVMSEGSITFDNAGSEAPLWGLSVQATEYALYTEKNLTVNSSPISLTVTGTDDGNESAMSASAYVGNADAAETSVDISNSTMTLMCYGRNSTDLLVNSGTVSIDSSTLKVLDDMDASSLVSGIHNRNGDININKSTLNIKLHNSQFSSCSAICAEQAETDPAPNPSIRITNSDIISTTACRGLVALDGGIVCESSNVDIASDETALIAGPGGLSLKNGSARIKSTGGVDTNAVDSRGPVTFDNAQVYLEAEGVQSAALYGSGPVTISGAATLVDMIAQYAAFELHSADSSMDSPLTLNDGLTAFIGGTLQYVDEPSTGSPNRIYSFSEGTLGMEGYLLENASTHVSIANTSGLIITGQPQDAIVSYPAGAEFEVELYDPSLVASYQWICTNDSGQEFVLENPTANQPKLVIPCTKQHSSIQYYRCQITDKNGNVLESRRATLDLDNREVDKTVIYAAWNAIEPGGSLDLSEAGLGSGTIVFDPNGTTVTFDNVQYDNTDKIYDDHLVPNIGITFNRKSPGDAEYELVLKGDCTIRNSFIQDITDERGISLDFMLYGDEGQHQVVHVREDSSGGSLAITGGTIAFRALADLDLNANVTTKTDSLNYMDGIISEAFNLASGYTVDLNANGSGISTEGTTSFGDNTNVKIDMMPTSNSASTEKAALFVSTGDLTIGEGAVVDITCHTTPDVGVQIEGLAGILVPAKRTMTATGAEITIGMSAEKGEQYYASSFNGILGSDNSQIILDHTNFSIVIDAENAVVATGIYSGGDLTMTGCTALVDVTAVGSADGITPEGDMTIVDSTVEVDTKSLPYQEQPGRAYAIAASSINVDLQNEGRYIKANAENTDGTGIAFLAKTGGSGSEQKGYDPSYVPRRITLAGSSSCILPDMNQISLVSIPGTVHDYIYVETYYDLSDTSKPAPSVTIVAAEDLSGATVEPAKGKYTYTGKAIKPAVTVSLGGQVLEQGRDYTVKYSKNKNVGTATITVAGRGGYAGKATAAFKIVPKGTKLTSVSGGKESFTAKWKKQAKQVTGYKVQYSTSETFASGNKTVTVPSAKTTSKKIKGLKSKTTYYVRIRTYKTVDGVNYYSGWSEKKPVKTS